MSLEKFEDACIEGNGGRTYYLLKHIVATVMTRLERMRNRDSDLRKTLSM